MLTFGDYAAGRSVFPEGVRECCVLLFLLSRLQQHALPHLAPQLPRFASAKSLIRDHMNDPESLQYRNLRVVHATINGTAVTIVCGDYNAKNKFGGYVGFETFAFEPTLLKGVLILDDPSSGHFSFFGLDGGNEMDHPEIFSNADTTGHIFGACLGLK